MKHYKKILLFLLFLTGCYSAFSRVDPAKLAEQYRRKYNELEAFNDANERRGRKDLNQYVIALDTNNWIEERPLQIILQYKYNGLRDALVEFNSMREDSLRLYVVVVSNYYAELKSKIDIDSMPRGRIRNLREYFALENKDKNDENNFRFFLEDSQEVVATLSKEMTDLHFKNRILYFCGIIQYVDVERKVHFMLSDNLLIDGPKLKQKEYAIRYRATANWDQKKDRLEPISDKIEKAVYNLINSVRMVIDAGIDNDPSLTAYGCRTLNLREAIGATQAQYEANFSKDIAATSYLIDNASGEQKHKCRYLIIDTLKNFPSDNLLLHHILPDKLAMIGDEGYSNYKIYVVLKEISFAMEPADWINFAQKVYEKSSVAKQEGKILLITIPYYKGTCTFTNMLGSEVGRNGMLLLPGVYCPSNPSLAAEMNAALGAGSTLTDVPFPTLPYSFNEALKRVPKKYRIYAYKLTWNGELLYEGMQEKESVKGSENLAEVEMVTDARYYEYERLNTELIAKLSPSPCMTNDCPALVEYRKKIEELRNKPPKYELAGNTNLVQSRLNNSTSNALDFASWYAGRITKGKLTSLLNAPDDEVFYGGKNMVRVMDNLAILDNVSIVASLFGLDVVFDSYGAYYSYKNGLYEEAAMYTVGVAIPLVCGGALRKAIKKGEQIITKTLTGKSVVLPARLANSGVAAANKLSSFSNNILEGEAVTQLAKHQADAPFIEKVEAGMLSDPTVSKQLSEKPELVDAMHNFHANGGGDVPAFRTHREDVLKLGLDYDVLYSFEKIQEKPGWFTVVLHGSDNGVFSVKTASGWVEVDHRALATYMKKNGWKEGMPVRLVACDAGYKRGLKNPVAQDLSNKLGVPVMAPDVPVRVNAEGVVISADPSGYGSWWTFDPGYGSPKSGDLLRATRVGEVGAVLGTIPIDKSLVAENALNSFKANKSDDLVKRIVDKKKDDHTFIEEVFAANAPPDQMIGPSMRTYKTPFTNNRLPQDKIAGVKYFNETERKAYEATVQNGEWHVGDQLVYDEIPYIFVMDKNGRIYMHPEAEAKHGEFHHSSFTAGSDVAMAGRVEFRRGKLTYMDNGSGHYTPMMPALEDGMTDVTRELAHRGVDLESVKFKDVND